MDEKLQKQLIRQLKILNFWITTLGILLLISLIAIGYLLFQAISYVREASNNINEFRESTSNQLNVPDRACQQDGAIGDYLRRQTNVCDNQ